MELAHRWSDRNLTKLEYVFALLILAILIGTFSRYVLVVFSRAEQTMINSTVININTALNYRAAMAVMRGEYQELETFEKTNPMEAMQTKIDINDMDMIVNDLPLAAGVASISAPANYGGEINTYTKDSMEKGKWYFNQDNRHLIYLVSNSAFFSSGVEGRSMIQFRIAIDYEDRNANGHYDPAIDEFRSMKLQPIEQYQWNY